MPIRHLSELNPYDNNRLKRGAGKERNIPTVPKGCPVSETDSVRSQAKKARVPLPSEGQSISTTLPPK